MRTKYLMLLAVMLIAIALNLSCGGGVAQGIPDEVKEEKEVRVEKSWNGEININLKHQAPEDGFIVSKDAWERLWKTFRENEEVPDINFDKQIVLIGVNRDPNRISMVPVKLSEDGDLKVAYISTNIGFLEPKTCRYLLAVVNNDGVKTVNSKPVPRE